MLFSAKGITEKSITTVHIEKQNESVHPLLRSYHPLFLFGCQHQAILPGSPYFSNALRFMCQK